MGIEATIEKDAREYIEARGGKSRKWVSPGHKGVPDRILSHPNTGPFAIEFKSPGKKLDPLQEKVCNELAREGWRVYAPVATIRAAREIIDDEIAGTPGARHPYMDGIE